MKSILKNYKSDKLIIIILIFAFIGIAGIEKLTQPIPLTYQAAVKKVLKKNKSVEIIFNDNVNNYEIIDSEYTEEGDHQIAISAWQTLIGKYTKNNKTETVSIEVENKKVDKIFYIANQNKKDVIIYGEQMTGGQITLPRLAMNYYFVLNLILLIVSMLSLYVFKKNTIVRKVFKTVVLFTLSYIISSMVMLGFNQTTYFISRDLAYVMISTLLLSSILYTMSYKKINNTSLSKF